jgi:hypothetical protein
MVRPTAASNCPAELQRRKGRLRRNHGVKPALERCARKEANAEGKDGGSATKGKVDCEAQHSCTDLESRMTIGPDGFAPVYSVQIAVEPEAAIGLQSEQEKCPAC